MEQILLSDVMPATATAANLLHFRQTIFDQHIQFMGKQGKNG
jgi:hypothetical protein